MVHAEQLSVATGRCLDRIGVLYDTHRNPGEDDDSYRGRIVDEHRKVFA